MFARPGLMGSGFGRAGAAAAAAGDATLALSYNYLKNSGSSLANTVVVGPTPTFTRASIGWNIDENGLLVEAAVDVPRFHHALDGTALGLLLEKASTNRLLHNRDGSNVAWTKSASMSATKTATGMDGVANSATRLLSAAGNQTCIQTVVLGSVTRTFSTHVKRVTGTGNIDITNDGGASWQTLTGLSSSDWTVHQRTQGGATFAPGFRIVTSGDAIEFDVAQLEDGDRRTSPIITGGAAVTRALDNDRVTGTDFTDFYNQPAGTLISQFYLEITNTSETRVSVAADNGANTEVMRLQVDNTASASTAFMSDGGVTQMNLVSGNPAVDTVHKHAVAASLNDGAACYDGEAVDTDGAVTMPTPTILSIGSRNGTGSGPINGCMQSLLYYNERKSDAFIQAATT